VVPGARGKGEAPGGFILAVTLWLWFTVLFANFAEAVAEAAASAGGALMERQTRHHGEEAGQAAEGSQSVARCLRRVAQGRGVLVEAGDSLPRTAK